MAKNSFVNVGRLVGELQEYEEKYWHYNVVCWVQDEEDFRALGGNDVTVEPHLSVFDGLSGLEEDGKRTQMDAFCYPSSDAAFDAACGALKQLL